MYQIQFDERTHILKVSASGFWDLDEAKRYGHDLGAAVGRLRASSTPFSLLDDSRDFPIQSKEVLEYLDKISHTGTVKFEKRAAILVKTMLQKLQSDRLWSHLAVKVFFDESEAERWLTEG